MKTMDTIRRLALVALLLASPSALTSCGNANGGEQTASDHVGPIGPTNPSAYYFDLTVSPHTITSGSNIVARIQVWDENGNTASGVPVAIAGDSGDPKDAFATTGSDGWVRWVIQVAYPAGSYYYVTVSIEDKVLTVPVLIVPGTITSG